MMTHKRRKPDSAQIHPTQVIKPHKGFLQKIVRESDFLPKMKIGR
jgi:hypothetical protein